MRRAGWEQRIESLLADAREKPYELGEWDCFRLACSAFKALTGEDRWLEFAGQYSTKRMALRLLAKHGSSFEVAFDWFFRSVSTDVRYARRGDIVALQTEDGEKHLGVVTLNGAQAAMLGHFGLIFVPVTTCLCCWRID